MYLFEWNIFILIEISLKLVHMGPTNNKPSLIQIIMWYWTPANSFFEPMKAMYSNALGLNEFCLQGVDNW